jgi:endonuclease/exonuclease/phosphatase (EEP) superfamily protein YafD
MGVAIALVAPLAVGLLGDLYWGFDLLANFRPHVGVVLLVIGAVWWWAEREAASVLLFAGIVGVSSLAPAFIGSSPAPADETIEIMTFNVGISNPNRAEVAEFIDAEEPDLVFLFESSFEWEEAMERAGLDLRPVSTVPRTRLAGVTVLASLAIDPVALEVDIRGEAAAVTVTIDGVRVDVVGIHPPSPISRDRAARRDRMMTATGNWVAARDNPVVVVGDFNATPWSSAHRTLRWRGLLVDSLHGAGSQPTWPDGWGPLSIPIDHVLHTRDLGSEDRRIGPSFGSAHRPVLVSIGPVG